MNLTGTIIQILPAREGVSQRTGNPWKIQEYVLETDEQYPRKVCFEVFGEERINYLNLQLYEKVTLEIDIESHEFNGRWFTSVKAISAARLTGGTAPSPTPQPTLQSAAQEDDGGIPF